MPRLLDRGEAIAMSIGAAVSTIAPRTPRWLSATTRGWRGAGSLGNRSGTCETVSCPEVREHGQHPAMSFGVLRDVELREDVSHVCLDRLLAHEQALGNPTVGETFGHQREDLPFSLRKRAKGVL